MAWRARNPQFFLPLVLFWGIVGFNTSIVIGAGAGGEPVEREWKSASGSHSMRATLVRQGNGKVQLRKPDGKTVVVDVDRLSDADQDYLRQLRDEVAENKGSITAEQVEKEATSARTAKEALLIYQFHLANESLPSDQRIIAADRLVHWRKLAEQDYERLGDQWMPSEEAEAQRKKAKSKIDYGLEMLRLGNGSISEKALREASRLDPDNIQANFLMAMVYSIVVQDDEKAIRHFKECLERDPNNVGVWNNIAICYFFEEDYNNAARAWLKAVELSPTTPVLAQNLGTLISLDARLPRIRVGQRQMDALSDAYEQLITTHSQKPPEKLDFFYIPPAGLSQSDEGGGASQLVVVGSGSGFVISPGIIATNHHVIEGADQLLILDPSDTDKHLGAELIAADEAVDLALVRCDDLDAPGLVLCDKLPRRGSDIMVLGYPLGRAFGDNLKATRGAMVAMPDKANDGLCLYDALTNPGNSGGPVVDQEGRVVAVVRAITGHRGGTYGAAIPMEAAMRFFRRHLPDLEAVSNDAEPVEWPQVDARVAPSTVLILQKQATETFKR